MYTKPVMIFEPNAGGHLMVWVRRILERASSEKELSLQLVTTAEALSHPSAAGIQDLESDNLQICLIEPDQNAYSTLRRLHPVLQQQALYSQALSKVLKHDPSKFSHVFIPFFDAYFLWPALLKPILLGPITLSGVVHRTKYHLPSMGIKTRLNLHSRVERVAYGSILNFQRTIQLYTVDPYFAEFQKNKRLIFLRDPAEYRPSDPQKLRLRLGIEPHQMLVLVYGYIDSRKALKYLLRALTREDASGICLLVAGEQSDETKELLSFQSAKALEKQSKLFQIARYLSEQEADEAFAASDLIWSCYANADGNSGVLIKAGLASRAAVVGLSGITSKLVADNRAGWIADPADTASIAAVLSEARDNPSKRFAFAHNLHKLFREHTRDNFAGPLVDHLVAARQAARG